MFVNKLSIKDWTLSDLIFDKKLILIIAQEFKRHFHYFGKINIRLYKLLEHIRSYKILKE